MSRLAHVERRLSLRSAGRDSLDNENVRSPSLAVTLTAAFSVLRKVDGMLIAFPSSSVDSVNVAGTDPPDSSTI